MRNREEAQCRNTQIAIPTVAEIKLEWLVLCCVTSSLVYDRATFGATRNPNQ